MDIGKDACAPITIDKSTLRTNFPKDQVRIRSAFISQRSSDLLHSSELSTDSTKRTKLLTYHSTLRARLAAATKLNILTIRKSQKRPLNLSVSWSDDIMAITLYRPLT